MNNGVSCLLILLIIFLIPRCSRCGKAGSEEEKARGPEMDEAVLKKAAGYFHAPAKSIEAKVECRGGQAGAAVFVAWRSNVKDGESVAVIRFGGKLVGPDDEGYGPELAFKACNVFKELPDEVNGAAGLFNELHGRSNDGEGRLITDLHFQKKAEDGTIPHLPAVAIIDGGWNLTFWTDEKDRCIYRRFKVFVMRNETVELKAVDEYKYDCK